MKTCHKLLIPIRMRIIIRQRLVLAFLKSTIMLRKPVRLSGIENRKRESS